MTDFAALEALLPRAPEGKVDAPATGVPSALLDLPVAPQGSLPRISGSSDEVWDKEAEKVFASLNITTLPGVASNHLPLNAIYEDLATGGKVYVGNLTAARSLLQLSACRITHVVNCCTKPNYHDTGKGITYLRFPIANFREALGDSGSSSSSSSSAVLAFYAPLFEFVDTAVAAGHGVLIHCVAGAHRAGTAGVSYLMHVKQINAKVAIACARRARPVIDPIGIFPELLAKLEEASRRPGELVAKTDAAATADADDAVAAADDDMETSLLSPIEVWLDLRVTGSRSDDVKELTSRRVFDRVLVAQGLDLPGMRPSISILTCESPGSGGTDTLKLFERNGDLAGASLAVTDAASQAKATALVGSVAWVHVDALDGQPMIVAENLLSLSEDTPTKVAATAATAQDVPGLAFALQRGVDALVVAAPSPELLEALEIAKAQRGEVVPGAGTLAAAARNQSVDGNVGIELQAAVVRSVTDGGVADRVCLDFTTLLASNEGCLVGSSAKALSLVLGETVASGFVPPRPFRVNAGPVHSYVLMADGSTKYLCEVQGGDRVAVVSSASALSASGKARSAVVGRSKVEPRPTLRVTFEEENGGSDEANRGGSVFLQQAETVRLASGMGKSEEVKESEGKPVTALLVGDWVAVRWASRGTHVGKAISGRVVEQ